MPELRVQVSGVEPAARGLVPLIQFKLEVSNTPAGEQIQSVILQTQIQIQAPQRSYNADEKAKLIELFGTPDQWGRTIRNQLWTQANTVVRSFCGSTTALLPVPCTYDLNVSTAKYFHALENGDIPLLFLFSGTLFYSGSDGRLQVQQIPWNTECIYRMPVNLWHGLMEHHWPNSAWLALRRDVFERLLEFKRGNSFPTWEETMERLLKAYE